MKRSIFRTKQKQKHQNDIDFANVCCFKFVEFEFFVFLLIDAFWLIANIEIWRVDDKQTNKQKFVKKNRWIDCVTNSHWLLFFISSCHLFSYRYCDVIEFIFYDVDCENVKNRTKQRMRFWNRWNKFIKINETKRNSEFFVWCFECWFVC